MFTFSFPFGFRRPDIHVLEIFKSFSLLSDPWQKISLEEVCYFIKFPFCIRRYDLFRWHLGFQLQLQFLDSLVGQSTRISCWELSVPIINNKGTRQTYCVSRLNNTSAKKNSSFFTQGIISFPGSWDLKSIRTCSSRFNNFWVIGIIELVGHMPCKQSTWVQFPAPLGANPE